MPSQTPYANLTLYDSTTDKNEKFGSFRDALAGTGDSNMTKIDTLLSSQNGQLDVLQQNLNSLSENFNQVLDQLSQQITEIQQKDTQQDNDIATKATTTTYTADISTTWSGSGPYTQTVTVTGILATDNPIVDIYSTSAAETFKQELKAYAMVGKVITGTNTITLTCYDKKPTTAFKIQLKVVR